MIDGLNALESLAFSSAENLLHLYRSGQASPVMVVEQMLARIRALDADIKAYRIVDSHNARTAALASEQRWRRKEPLGPLDGVPFSVKDTLMVQGHSFRQGSCATADIPATENSPIVDRMRESGAVFLGITATPEFGAGPVTISPLTGVTRNPWNLQMHAGGSSGGAAASTAAGLTCLALGTDTGGSVRIPSAFCGTVGFKPTGGRIPVYPHNGAGQLGSPGVIARSVEDICLTLAVVARPDLRDPDCLPPDDIDWPTVSKAGVVGLRAALTTTMGYAKRVDPEVVDLVTTAAGHLETLGVVVEEADPGIANPSDIVRRLTAPALAYAVSTLSKAQQALVGDSVRTGSEVARKMGLRAYLNALEQRREVARVLNAFHQKYDILLTPTVSVAAFEAHMWVPENFADLDDRRAWTPFCYPFNLSQQPAITVPCGLTRAGLPIGLQIVGPRFGDALVLRAALSYEQIRPFRPLYPTSWEKPQ